MPTANWQGISFLSYAEKSSLPLFLKTGSQECYQSPAGELKEQQKLTLGWVFLCFAFLTLILLPGCSLPFGCFFLLLLFPFPHLPISPGLIEDRAKAPVHPPCAPLWTRGDVRMLRGQMYEKQGIIELQISIVFRILALLHM